MRWKAIGDIMLDEEVRLKQLNKFQETLEELDNEALINFIMEYQRDFEPGEDVLDPCDYFWEMINMRMKLE